MGQIDESGTTVTVLAGYSSTYELALASIARGLTLERLAASAGVRGEEPLPARCSQSGRLLPPLTHPDPAHCLVSGTGLTHLGSASTRDAMHLKAKSQPPDEAGLTDSMRMFQWGVEGGRPPEGDPARSRSGSTKGTGRDVGRVRPAHRRSRLRARFR